MRMKRAASLMGRSMLSSNKARKNIESADITEPKKMGAMSITTMA